MDLLYSLMLLTVGGALLLLGFRLARFIIPLWGFVAGISVGGSVISAMDGTPFLGTVLGIVVGLVLGLLFAVFAYMYYAVAIIVLIGAVGYWLGSGFILVLGFNPGVLSFIFGAIGGILMGVVALVLNAPKYTLILATTVGGATAIVGSLLLLFNQIDLEDLNYSAVHQTFSNSFVWTLAALALIFVGIAVQAKTTATYGFETWSLDEGNPGAKPPKADVPSSGSAV